MCDIVIHTLEIKAVDEESKSNEDVTESLWLVKKDGWNYFENGL